MIGARGRDSISNENESVHVYESSLGQGLVPIARHRGANAMQTFGQASMRFAVLVCLLLRSRLFNSPLHSLPRTRTQRMNNPNTTSCGASTTTSLSTSVDANNGIEGQKKSKLRIGVVADIQYADVEDGFSFSGNPRYYRHALDATTGAARHFQDDAVDLVINLGDTVDGKCNRDIAQLDRVIDALHDNFSHGKILHVYGNHCLYNADRDTLQEKLGVSMTREADGELVGYYSHIVGDVRLVVIDSYDVCMHRGENSSKQARAVEILKQNNSKNFQDGNPNSPEGLEDLQRRYVGFNGAVGKVQLEWLTGELESARDHNHQVILLSHQPILPQTTHPVCLIWNFHEILDILKSYNDVVVASLSGHAHKYGYKEWNGIHFRVIEAVLETPRPHHTYCIIDLFDDALKVNGYGECESALYEYRIP